MTDLQKTEPTSAGLRRLVFKIRTGGIDWVRKRIASEFLTPTTTPGQTLHAAARRGIAGAAAIRRALGRLGRSEVPHASTTLFAFYDLKVAPITYDFLWFLAGADVVRRRLGLDNVHVVIVPGPHNQVRRERDDYEDVVDPDVRRGRIHSILIPACQLLPSCQGLTLAGSRDEAAFSRSNIARHVYPSGYEPVLPTFAGSRECLEAARAGDRSIASLRATQERLRDVDHWIANNARDRQLVVLTMRRYDYMPGRNSDIQAWTAFARTLDAARFVPVFIPDTADTAAGVPAELKDFHVCREAAWDMSLRMAFYQRAFLNLGVNTGPMGLCWLNALTRYATFKMAVAGVPQNTSEFYRSLGFRLGRSHPFASSTQLLVWEDDTLPVIRRTFERLLETIEDQATSDSIVA